MLELDYIGGSMFMKNCSSTLRYRHRYTYILKVHTTSKSYVHFHEFIKVTFLIPVEIQNKYKTNKCTIQTLGTEIINSKVTRIEKDAYWKSNTGTPRAS